MKRSKSNKNQIKKRGSSFKLGSVFDKHVKFEFEDKDVESTMKTMVKEPYVHHVPVVSL
jgi:carboxymethylenebutenolidase